TQLSESQGSVASLTAQLADSERRIALLQAPAGGSIAPALQRSLRGEIMFRTNDSTVGADTTDRLIELAQVLAVAPEAVVQIDGYADPRGTKEENLVLSEQRAEAVRAALIAGGLEADRILVRPHGEHATVSARGDVDGYALERRVVITIGAKQPAVAEVTD
ncbi:MAG TPA: OmpA family protein, partial [Steroidobacteraceae bacterium]|nr:OmpA family protein [Steroidobacteraceae bacterium]